jgi:hypothetical protein
MFTATTTTTTTSAKLVQSQRRRRAGDDAIFSAAARRTQRRRSKMNNGSGGFANNASFTVRGDEKKKEEEDDDAREARRSAMSRRSMFMANAVFYVMNASPASAMFNSGLDVPIEEPLRAVAVVMAVKVALRDIADQNEDFRKTCDAPVYACDLSQLNVKCATRVSGPMTRALPTILETYGLDPYEVEALKQSIQELETQLKANNARVAVNFKAPAEYFDLIDRQIDELLTQLPEDAMSSARDLFENGCDLSVPAEQPAELDCRIARAVSQGKRPSGGVS